MTFDERASALEPYGFTARQAQFLVTVMLHAGVCVERQYCAFAGIVHGQKSRNFFDRLVAQRYAVVHQFPSKHQGRIFHIRHKRLYAAIVQENNRNRRAMPVHRAIERLMLLDAVLADRSLTWLGTEADKLVEFERTAEGRVDMLPHVDYRAASGSTRRRYFTDKLSIGVESGGFRYVFLYLISRHNTLDFRAFLLRHARLFTRLHRWTLRLLVPRPFRAAAPAYVAAVHDQLATPIDLRVRNDLEWYFEERQRLCRVSGPPLDPERFARAQRAYARVRFQVMYRQWLREGDAAMNITVSQHIDGVLRRGMATIEVVPLTHQYLHLASSIAMT